MSEPDWGYFWVLRFENDKTPSVAYKSKGGRWSFMGQAEWTKLVHKTGVTRPAKVLQRIEYKEQE